MPLSVRLKISNFATNTEAWGEGAFVSIVTFLVLTKVHSNTFVSAHNASRKFLPKFQFNFNNNKKNNVYVPVHAWKPSCFNRFRLLFNQNRFCFIIFYCPDMLYSCICSTTIPDISWFDFYFNCYVIYNRILILKARVIAFNTVMSKVKLCLYYNSPLTTVNRENY